MAYGISSLPWSVFLPLNVVASGIWALAIVSAGYAFGQVSEKMMSDASSSLGFVMLVLFLGLSWILSRKFDAVVAQNAAAESAAKQLAQAAAMKLERQKGKRDRQGRGKVSGKRAERHQKAR